MTAPPSSAGSSGSTASVSMSSQYGPQRSKSLSHLHPSNKQSSIRSLSLHADDASSVVGVGSSGKSKLSKFLKYPKKILNTGKYPQTKIVKDSIPSLNDELEILTKDAPFIDAVTPDPTVCLFDRKELVLGELLGQGQFAQVYEVSDLKLREERSAECSKEEQSKRETFVQDFHHCPSTHSSVHSSHCHSYAVKHLKKDLLINPSRVKKRRHKREGGGSLSAGDSDLPMDQQFQLAASDLIVEALYLSRLQHPHILKVRGMALGGTAAFASGRYNSYFLVLDRLKETLDQRIRSWNRTLGQPQETQLCTKTEYAYLMAQALEYLHSNRIIFRDLKPSNIGFKAEDDTLQIFDFGLCRELPSAQTKDPDEVFFMTAAGTHRYMAVEVHLGQQYNAKADVYSFAMVFYELLAQEAPFLNLGDDDHRKLVCERQHRPKYFNGCAVPLTIQKLLDSAWAHQPKDRATMKEVVQKLQDILVNTFQQEVGNDKKERTSNNNGEDSMADEGDPATFVAAAS